jgi:WD40 repeat protein
MNLTLKLLSTNENPIRSLHSTKSRDVPHLIAVDSKHRVILSDPEILTQTLSFSLDIKYEITATFVKNSTLYVGDSSGEAAIVDLNNGKIIKSLKIAEVPITEIVYQDQAALMFILDNGRILICHSDTLVVTKCIEMGFQILSCYLYSEKQILTILDNNLLMLANIESKEVEHSSKLGHSLVTASLFNSGILYYGCSYGNLFKIDLKTYLKDTKNSKIIGRKEHSSWILAIKQIGSLLVTAGDDRKVVIWNSANLNVLFRISDFSNSIGCIEEVENKLFTGSYDGRVMYESIEVLHKKLKEEEEKQIAAQRQKELEIEKEKAKKKRKPTEKVKGK